MLVRDNKYIPSEDKDFFILLRIGLWQKVEEPLSENPDWNYIYKLSCDQTVQGIVADGLGIYQSSCPDCIVPEEINNLFIQQSAIIMKRNLKINQLQAKVCKKFNEEGIKYVVVKGQGVAQCYPKPLLRCSGDIDFHLLIEQQQQVNHIINHFSENLITDVDDPLHYEINVDGVQIEFHYGELTCLGSKAKVYFQELQDTIINACDYEAINLNGVESKLPPLSFHAFYIFLHFLKHYLTYGTGLRQIIDWIMFLKTNQSTIKRHYLRQYLEQINFSREWDFFLSFALIFLDAPKESLFDYLIRSKNVRDYSLPFSWKVCKKAGNFNHNIQYYHKDFFERHWRSLAISHNIFLTFLFITPFSAIKRWCSFLVNFIISCFSLFFASDNR